MVRSHYTRTLTNVVLVIMLASAGIIGARAQANGDDLSALGKQVARLFGQGKYAEATPLAERALALAELQFGPNHPNVAFLANNLGAIYRLQGRYPEAEAVHRRALAISEKSWKADQPAAVADALNYLALLYQAQSRYADAEPFLKRALSIRAVALGPEHIEVAKSLNNIANLYIAMGRYAESEPIMNRALAIKEKALGSEPSKRCPNA